MGNLKPLRLQRTVSPATILRMGAYRSTLCCGLQLILQLIIQHQRRHYPKRLLLTPMTTLREKGRKGSKGRKGRTGRKGRKERTRRTGRKRRKGMKGRMGRKQREG